MVEFAAGPSDSAPPEQVITAEPTPPEALIASMPCSSATLPKLFAVTLLIVSVPVPRFVSVFVAFTVPVPMPEKV